MIYTVCIALALVAFLVVLNGFLRGAKKVQIDAVLSVLLIGLTIVAFFVSGWKFGLLAVAVTFISAAVARPIAARLASRLSSASSHGGVGYVGLPPARLKKISQELGRPFDPNKVVEALFSDDDSKTIALNALLEYCEQQPAIQSLLREFKVSRPELEELYHQLVMVGAGQWACGHWVAASALAYPDSLRYLLARRKGNTQEAAVNLIIYFERGMALETLT